MWRRESPSKAPQDHSKQPKMTGNDIIQLYNSESKAAKEKKKKLDEIQRRARKKDHTHYLSLAETQARMEKRRKQHMYKQLQAGSSRTKLPAIQISTDSRKTNSNHERSSKRLSQKDEHFWPDIDLNNLNNSRRTDRGNKLGHGMRGEPSRDPRFQDLLACLLADNGHYGDLQRFAPPRTDKDSRTRIGLGFC